LPRTFSEIIGHIAGSTGREQDSFCDKVQSQIDVSVDLDKGELICKFQINVSDSASVISTIGVAINYLEDGVNVPRVLGTVRLDEVQKNQHYVGTLIDARLDLSNDVNGVVELGVFVLDSGTEFLCLSSQDFTFLSH